MFKQMLTLFRGQIHEAAGRVTARQGLVVLDQQIRDVAAYLRQARRALALAMAEDSQEAARVAALGQRIAGLEAQARAALAGGRNDLALTAAGTIAALERDQAASLQARRNFTMEIARLRDSLAAAERRYADLHRGRRLARVGDAVQQAALGAGPENLLGEAEATLARLRGEQALAVATQVRLREMTAENLEETLGAAGFGPAIPNAASVLARLQQRVIAQS